MPKPLAPSGLNGFDELWNRYPKRVARKDAMKAWQQLNPDQETIQKMLDALDWQVNQESWRRDGGQYVPYLATWIRGERWYDEPRIALSPGQAMRDAKHEAAKAQQIEYWRQKQGRTA